jgi:acyl-CoA thioester hydrolase
MAFQAAALSIELIEVIRPLRARRHAPTVIENPVGAAAATDGLTANAPAALASSDTSGSHEFAGSFWLRACARGLVAGPTATARALVRRIDDARGIVPRMLGSIHTYELTIHEGHLDTFGHVNNATYLELFEEARWQLITGNGYGLDEIKRRQAGPTILEINLRFAREVCNRERVTVRSWTESYTGKVHRFQQQMQNSRQEVCCEAAFVIGLFDLQTRKLILPTPEWLRGVGLAGQTACAGTEAAQDVSTGQ